MKEIASSEKESLAAAVRSSSKATSSCGSASWRCVPLCKLPLPRCV